MPTTAAGIIHTHTHTHYSWPADPTSLLHWLDDPSPLYAHMWTWDQQSVGRPLAIISCCAVISCSGPGISVFYVLCSCSALCCFRSRPLALCWSQVRENSPIVSVLLYVDHRNLLRYKALAYKTPVKCLGEKYFNYILENV